jgi:hypothetical protein
MILLVKDLRQNLLAFAYGGVVFSVFDKVIIFTFEMFPIIVSDGAPDNDEKQIQLLRFSL